MRASRKGARAVRSRVTIVAGYAGRGVCPAVEHHLALTRPAVREDLAAAGGPGAPHQCRERQDAHPVAATRILRSLVCDGATRPVPPETGRRISPLRRAHFVNTQRGSPRRFLCVGCFEEHHDENAQTETNEQGKTDDEDVFHARSLRFDTLLFLRQRRPQRRERIRDVNHNLLACCSGAHLWVPGHARLHRRPRSGDGPPSAQARLYEFCPKIDAGEKRDASSLDSRTERARVSAPVVASLEVCRPCPVCG
jgi:hypothetical protein